MERRLLSETPACQIVRLQIGDTPVAVVDTPGLDDTKRSDTEILDEITQFLATQYSLGIPLKGVIYLHRITDNKMQGNALRYFRMFQKLCGDQALGNVVLVTTMWDQLKNSAIGLQRDQQLRDEFWNLMAAKGSHITSFDGSPEMAETIVWRLMRKSSVVLDIQREVVDEGRRLDETSAGRVIAPAVDDRLRKDGEEIARLDRCIASVDLNMVGRKELERQRGRMIAQRQRDASERDRLRANIGKEVSVKVERAKKGSVWKDAVTTFASVLGLSISVVTNLILPLCGVGF